MRWPSVTVASCALLVAGCGGLADSNSGDAGIDAERTDGPTSRLDSGSIDTGSEDGGRTDGARDASRDAAFPDVLEAATSCLGASSGDSGSPPPSCAPGGPGMTNCGPGGRGAESCCTSLEVCGGTYHRTYTSSGSGPMGEADPATVSNFRLDEYLVTVGRFRQFVNAWNGGAGYTPPAGSGKHVHLNGGLGLENSASPGTYEPGWAVSDEYEINPTNDWLGCSARWQTWTNSAGGNENLPINCANWFESYAFCIWDGGFLPSEAEWEYAAAGGAEQREHPWGSTDPGTANQYAIYGYGASGTPDPDCYFPGEGPCAGFTNMAPVGTPALGAGLWGQLDMAGEASEWTLDWLASGYVDPSMDAAYLTPTGNKARVRRGGHFASNAYALVPTYRLASQPIDRTNITGFRCARSP